MEAAQTIQAPAVNEPQVSPATAPVIPEVKDKVEEGTHVGQVKWFNPKLGYGFITVCDGNDKGKDIFAHHSGIKPLNSNYKTLEKGEYIQFNVVDGQNGIQAIDITGIKGGPLMCDFVIKRGTGGGGLPVPGGAPALRTEGAGSWQPVATGGRRPKNKLKYSKEGREILKTFKSNASNRH